MKDCDDLLADAFEHDPNAAPPHERADGLPDGFATMNGKRRSTLGAGPCSGWRRRWAGNFRASLRARGMGFYRSASGRNG